MFTTCKSLLFGHFEGLRKMAQSLCCLVVQLRFFNFNKFMGMCFVGICFSVTGCNSLMRNESHAYVPMESIESGKKLAEKHCQSCHQLPDPALLDAKTWETGALPAMGPRLGIFNYKGQSYTFRGDEQMMGPGYFAGKPKVTQEEWQSIVDYYTATSPDQLQAQHRSTKISLQLPLFGVLQPKLNYTNAQSCFVKVREHAEAPVVVSDAITLKTYFLDSLLTPVDSLTTDGPLVNIEFSGNEAVVCDVGILYPNDEAHGSAVHIKHSMGKWKFDSTSLFNGLRRPLQVSTADINNDGKTDYLVCEYGYLNGSFSWMENRGNNQYEKHILRQSPGVLNAYPFDYNKDGKTDIIALFAQGEEGIFLYTNNGNGRFEERELLRFPAVYGSSYFELADFNKDGLPDILYTCGDNADYTSVLKPYHGVYIFLNNGDKGFQQSFFYPIHGCYKAMARDFDKDGEIDLATIAYYADFATQPEEGFVYLENKGDLKFSAYTSPQLVAGRWITMDAGDIDGWADIVLGNFVQPSKLANPAITWSHTSPIMILKNKGRQ
ncbi:MAG: FG-GAP-like repeat-containing protein [Ginsengibacter sp.]